MDKFNSMAIFVEVALREGFTSAAEKLGLSRAQVSKSIMKLEAHLGTRLLNRTTRRVSLTEIGRIYLDRCKLILDDVNEIEAIASHQSTSPHGVLNLSSSTSFAVLHLGKAIPLYLKQFPDVKISLKLADRIVDVVAEGYDLVLRIAAMEDSSLIARRIAPCRRIYCASPHYISQHGEPKTPSDLKKHQCLIYLNDPKPDIWTLHGTQTESIKISGRMSADNGDLLKTAAINDLGICLLPTFIVGPDLKAGRLKQVLTNYCPPEISVYAIFPSHRYLSAKVRTFIDFLSDYFGDNPSWDQLI